MKFFIDTANVDEIRQAADMGIICGVTTNPSLIAKEGRDFKEVISQIASIVDGPISGEVKATTVDAEGMIAEGREIAAIHPNMVVKIPMTAEGLKATRVLSAEGIKVNVTLIFTANQALLAARAGAAFVSPFLGRLDDISQPDHHGDLRASRHRDRGDRRQREKHDPCDRLRPGRRGHRHGALQGSDADGEPSADRSGNREVPGGLPEGVRRVERLAKYIRRRDVSSSLRRFCAREYTLPEVTPRRGRHASELRRE